MKQVRNILASIFWGLLGVSVLVAVLFECEVLPSGEWTGQATAEFLCRCTMEVATLAGIWLALRLFKFRKVHADLLSRKAEALKKWGALRLLILEVPMLLNTLLYYMYMQTTYGYLAIIALLSLPFVFPTVGRCEDEVTEHPVAVEPEPAKEEEEETEA